MDNGEQKNFPRCFSNLDDYVFKDRPAATDGVHERILVAESMLAWIKGVDGVVPENLKSVHHKISIDSDKRIKK